MKKWFSLLLITTIFLVGCNSDQIQIRDGEITKVDGRVAVDIELDVQLNDNKYYKLSTSQNAVLTDGAGNQLRPISRLSSTDLDGTINQSGVYSTTLFFPMPKDLSKQLVLEIKNIKHYKRINSSGARNLLSAGSGNSNISISQEVNRFGVYSDLLGEYTIEFKFEVGEQELDKVGGINQEAELNLARDENVIEMYRLERVDLITKEEQNVSIYKRD
ncbi:hypothetical protein [Natroniella sp. ANB-PHB2]|uniref:hypothetical protein n=1 Tax=Natroniella sp. ANB-PHB2 TaxID=3384444 RepID=UPI0038D48500